MLHIREAGTVMECVLAEPDKADVTKALEGFKNYFKINLGIELKFNKYGVTVLCRDTNLFINRRFL